MWRLQLTLSIDERLPWPTFDHQTSESPWIPSASRQSKRTSVFQKNCHSPGCLTGGKRGPFAKQDDKLMRAIGFLGRHLCTKNPHFHIDKVNQKMLTSQIFWGCPTNVPWVAWKHDVCSSEIARCCNRQTFGGQMPILFQQLHPKSASNSCYTSIVLSKLGLSKWAKSRSIKSINHLYSVHVDAQILIVQHITGSLQIAPTSIVMSLELLVAMISLVWKSGAHPGYKK